MSVSNVSASTSSSFTSTSSVAISVLSPTIFFVTVEAVLDALDENENALTDYEKFSTLLERVTHNFYRVIITARTNFFENETKEQISNNKSNISMLDKISSSRKYYIAPFTDEDIKKFLRKRYHYNLKKFKRAWKIVEKNKNLSVRPLLLRFMDVSMLFRA